MSKIPFDPKELENTGVWPALMAGRPPMRKFNTPITPKENVRLFYSKKGPMWLPLGGDRVGLTPRVDPDNMARAFAFEVNSITPEEMVGGPDKFGIEWVYVPVAGGSMVKPGNPTLADVNDWKSIINFPDIETWDWAGSKAAHAEIVNDGRGVTVTILTGLFERLISFMDFENAALALIDDDQKDAIHELFDALADLYNKMVDKFIDAYGIDVLSFHDDWGSQRAPFFGLATVREMILPHMKKIVDHCHANGVFFDIHSCGKNEILAPAYIEAGCDSWSPQPMNDKALLFEKYGDQIIIGIEPDVPLMPDTPEEEQVAAAKRWVEKFGPTMDTKPVTCFAMMAGDAFTETLYVETRKLFCS